ncbi:unnamed protein product [Caenorhabditis bovis]|uniref:Beta-lactamase-related domain-containing protein n=1 Tax=Caenorhabditis bovis TaxID=2654633 RepID=A0A8S1FFL2_9PELO|nr:unnamed protein product [Caenorhabditis bovis]
MPLKTKKLIPIHGATTEQFADVLESFKRNFEEGWEKAGASFCVIHKGKVVVDVWGGYADYECRKEWKEDTISTIFSCTKSCTAICFAMLVDRGFCDYSDKVIKYWPEFGANGKQDVTIEMVLNHTAGLPYFPGIRFTPKELVDHEKMAQIIEGLKPVYPPGTRTAYHALTFGWLADCVFRKIDPQKRSVGQFFKEEIATKHHIDIHIGDCSSEENRLARLFRCPKSLVAREIGYDKSILTLARYFYNPRGYFAGARKNMSYYGADFTMFNNSDLRVVGQPGVNGIGSAKAMAQLHQLVLDGILISNETFEKIKAPKNMTAFDHLIGEPQNKEHGFTYFQSPKKTWQFGHPGVGGQMVRADPVNDIIVAYLTNGMKTAGCGDHVFTFNRLQRKTYECLDRIPKFELPEP